MQPEKHTVTQSQVVYSLINFNNHMKQYYPHAFDTKKFGWFIYDVRTMKMHEFENNKEELLKKLVFVNSCIDPNTKIFDMEKLF